VIRDPTSGVFLNRYQGVRGLGILRRSRELRGPSGADWLLVQYRLEWGYWSTAYQPVLGPRQIDSAPWSDIQWLRRPASGSER
jgi:hypothetical protein